MNISVKKGDKLKYWIYINLFLYCGFTVFVFLWMFMTSFKTNQELYASVWSLPKHLNLENYKTVWYNLDLKRSVLNSIVVGIISTSCLIFLGTPASYVIVRSKLKITKFINILFLIGLGVPIPIILIPLLTLFVKLRLGDSLIGLTIAYVAVNLPFTVYLLTGFLKTLPYELEEAAVIDGCSYLGSFWKIVFPLATPGIITATIFNFLSIWNEYFIALVFISSPEKFPLSLKVFSMQGSLIYTGDWVGLYAGIMILVIPTILIFILLSEKLIAGMTQGALKG